MFNIRSISSQLDPLQLGAFIQDQYNLGDQISVQLLKKGFNDHYLVKTSSKKFVMRVYSTISSWNILREQKEFEVEFMDYLSDNGIHVTKPVKTQSGDFLSSIKTIEGPRESFLMEYIPIERYEVTVEWCRKAGTRIGKFHEIAAQFQSNNRRLEIDLDYLIDHPIGKIVKYQPVIEIDHFPNVFEEVGMLLRKKIENLSLSDEVFGLIHGDLGLHNLIYYENLLHLFDFDLCGYGYRAFDLAVFKNTLDFIGRGTQEHQDAFDSGYDSVRTVGNDEKVLLDLMINAIHHIWLLGYWITFIPVLGLEYFNGSFDKTLEFSTKKLVAFLEKQKLKS
ncbi:MAG: phosphotransferase [Candidatus Heimdallarchaeota archaeon]|nr:phosphotransferase [Candidatus Heimdallarchaeota archaeon]